MRRLRWRSAVGVVRRTGVDAVALVLVDGVVEDVDLRPGVPGTGVELDAVPLGAGADRALQIEDVVVEEVEFEAGGVPFHAGVFDDGGGAGEFDVEVVLGPSFLADALDFLE